MANAMTVTIYVPTPLRTYSGGASELFLSVQSVRAALEELERSHPALHRSVCDETGAVRRHINLFVNASHVRDLEGLDTALVPGDVLTILPAVSGGRACRTGSSCVSEPKRGCSSPKGRRAGGSSRCADPSGPGWASMRR